MSQNISLWGATYSNVPAIDLPKSPSGTATFTDVTDTTATASDVASGKYFYTAAGVKTAGTGTGGGGGSVTQDENGYIVLPSTGGGGSQPVIVGALRPDAELFNTVTYDKYLVDDLGVTIPAYSTTASTILAASTIGESITFDNTQYSIVNVKKILVTPEYSDATIGKGRQIFWSYFGLEEYLVVNPDIIRSNLRSGRLNIYGNYLGAYNDTSRAVFDSSGSGGIYITSCTSQLTGNSQSSSITLDFYHGAISIKGHATYLNQTYWDYLTDIRFQFVIKSYRIPRSSSVDGFADMSIMTSIIDDYNNNNGVLT